MGFPRRYLTETVITIALIVGLICAFLSNAHAATAPAFSGALNIGAATANPDHFSPGSNAAMTCPVVQLQFRVNNLIGPFNFTGELRHAICDSDKGELFGKSRYCAGVELPLSAQTFLFANYERYYRQNDDWAWCGISIRFGP